MTADAMRLPKVSVIVPAYNAQERLARCLDALLAQTLREIEIIVVDDGSTDGTAAICTRYADAHANVVHITQANGGCSRARNAGLERARGRFIGFCDADDFVEPHMFERLEAAASAPPPLADLAACRYFGGRDNRQSRSNIETLGHGRHARAAIVADWLKPLVGLANGHSVHGFIWCCLFRTRILHERGIRFAAGLSMHEDTLFVMEYLAFAENVAIVDEPLYHYVLSSNSLTSAYFARREIADEVRIREKVEYHRRMADIAAEATVVADAREVLAHCLATWLYYAASLAIVEAASRPLAAVRGIGRDLDTAKVPFSAWRSLGFRQLAPFRRLFLALSAMRASVLVYLLCRLRKPRFH